MKREGEMADSPMSKAAEYKKHSNPVDFLIRLVREKPLGTVGALITLLLLLTGIFADFLAPYGMNEVHPIDALSPPSARFLLGTDNLGRDMLSRVIYGARISVIVGLAATALSTFLAVAIGMTSGYLGGKFDLVVQRFVDTWMCLPLLIVLMVIMSMVEPGMTSVIVVLGIGSGIRSSRVIRSAVIGIKENMYVNAARAIGCPTREILSRHILPNIIAPTIVIFTTQVPGVILTEASLSFLGFGIPPPAPSWGGMLSGPGRTNMFLAPWMAIWPGLALSIVVYGINMFGDAIRDILDPRLRGGVGRFGVRVQERASVKGESRDLEEKQIKEVKTAKTIGIGD
jgi:peptide/nickel transport system permease protein